MARKIIFEELGIKERILLLRAFDYDVDQKGYVLTQSGNRIPSTENPSKFLLAEKAMLIPGSLEVVDASPTHISKFIREREADPDGTSD